jgi:hypothetical protein
MPRLYFLSLSLSLSVFFLSFLFFVFGKDIKQLMNRKKDQGSQLIDDGESRSGVVDVYIVL